MFILEDFLFQLKGAEKYPAGQSLNSGFTAVFLIVVSYFNIVLVLWLFLYSNWILYNIGLKLSFNEALLMKS